MPSYRDRHYFPAVGFLAVVALVVLFVRVNAATFASTLDSIPFVFELMVAGTIIAVLRNEAGISTFGVFGPVIIAFAWLQIGPVWGVLLVLYIIFLALLVRLSLDPLNMGTPHRIATIIAVVVIGVVALEGIAQTELVPEFGAALLFPIILSAWYGDRLVNQVRDTSWAGASVRLAWTLAVITLAYLVIAAESFMNWFVHTPEAWFVLVAVNIFLGYRAEFRLSEYLRFNRLRRSLAGAGGEASGSDILRMRVRNRDFVQRYNPAYLLANLNKVRMKQYLHNLELSTPETYLVATDVNQLPQVRSLIDDRDEFVVKPSTGAGGEGILVVRGRTDETYHTSQGDLSRDELVRYVRSLLEGRFIEGYETTEDVYFEELVVPSGPLLEVSGSGVPDVRVIVLEGFPVMAMARLPTDESHGTANLHGGAVGVALSIAAGTAGRAFQQTQNRWLTEHPDTGKSLTDLEIDQWDEILKLASKVAASSHLGYAGVDIVFDEEEGPMVLEVNRRPGLGIQNVNMAGLLKRLRFVESKLPQHLTDSATEKVRQVREWDRESWEVTTDEA